MNLLEALSDNIVVDKDNCTFCGICVETCILDNLRMKLAPCRQACPLGVNAQGYIQLVGRGQEEKALDLVRETLPFPGILGRICSQPCEDKCHRRKITGQAVHIRALKRYLGELAFESEKFVPSVEPESGFKVAIVGAGPSGLLAAYDLRCKGHQIVVFEAKPEPGGMLRWAIPEFRLPRRVVEEEIAVLVRIGVDFRCSMHLGRDISLPELEEHFEAVVLALGCSSHIRLGIKGEGLKGVYHGLPFLQDAHSGGGPKLGGRVVVIGGGNTAIDAAQTALRNGAEKVTVVTLENQSELPAFPWAVEGALNDGVTLDCCWGPVAIEEQNGYVSGIELQHCVSIFYEFGQFKPRFDVSRVKRLPAEAVIIAIGQTPDISSLEHSSLLKGDMIRTDPLTLQTENEKIFLAGDFFSGPSSVVETMASGRQAAVSVDRFLNAKHLRYGRTYQGPIVTDFEIDTSNASDADRAELPARSFRGQGEFSEVELTMAQQMAHEEAKRCYSCGEPFGKYRTCWFCLPCEVECPHDALWVQIPYLLR